MVKLKSAKELLQQFCLGYKNRDLPLLKSLFTPNTTMWGTAIDEQRFGLNEVVEQLNRDWQQSEKGEIEIISYIADHDPEWVAARCQGVVTIQGETHIFEDLRGTIITVVEQGLRKITHMHASFPDFRNAANSSFPK